VARGISPLPGLAHHLRLPGLRCYSTPLPASCRLCHPYHSCIVTTSPARLLLSYVWWTRRNGFAGGAVLYFFPTCPYAIHASLPAVPFLPATTFSAFRCSSFLCLSIMVLFTFPNPGGFVFYLERAFTTQHLPTHFPCATLPRSLAERPLANIQAELPLRYALPGGAGRRWARLKQHDCWPPAQCAKHI